VDVVLFGITAVCALAGGAGVILSRRPVHSALGLLVVLVSLAVDYLLLDAQFIAAAQVIIYAGAIVVLFVFIIMLLAAQSGEHAGTGAFAGRAGLPVIVALCALLAAGLLALVTRPLPAGGPGGTQLSPAPQAQAPSPPPPAFGTIQDVGRALFGRYLLPFEAASLILLAGMIGAVALGRRLGPRPDAADSTAVPLSPQGGPGRDGDRAPPGEDLRPASPRAGTSGPRVRT
jgi:NADH-quinone oxidoreductase subunit J